MLQEALTELYERDVFYIVECFRQIFAASANFHIFIADIPVIAEVPLDDRELIAYSGLDNIVEFVCSYDRHMITLTFSIGFGFGFFFEILL